MKITVKQSHVLDNLHRVVMFRMLGGRMAPHLDGVKCDTQINSLAAKGLVKLDRRGKATKIGEPSGIVATRWSCADPS